VTALLFSGSATVTTGLLAMTMMMTTWTELQLLEMMAKVVV
jgi:hypothetical protein